MNEVRDLRTGTKALALRIMSLCDALPRSRSADVIAYQLLRAGSSPGAQYREGIRSRSNAELISKMESALQELEETAYWLELLVDRGIVESRRLAPLQTEVDEITRIFVACVKKLKARRR
ncbi:MAG TPA: four helix bundle protein [Thermoanaerobaculia bacterium]|nr:four helix bundle protein [Thermoanaerobaculia bacterium]